MLKELPVLIVKGATGNDGTSCLPDKHDWIFRSMHLLVERMLLRPLLTG